MRTPAATNVIASSVDASYIDIYFDGLPNYVGTVTTVTLRVQDYGSKMDLDVDFYVDGASLGQDSEAQILSWGTDEFNISPWNAPKTRREMMGSFFRLTATATGAFPYFVGVDWLEVDITYEEATMAQHFDEGPSMLRFATAATVEEKGNLRLGTIHGVDLAYAASWNGEGFGYLKRSNGTLAWKAPGSSSYGRPVVSLEDGRYSVSDGEDESKFILPEAYMDHVADSEEERILLQAGTRYDLNIDSDDALSGTAQSTAVYIVNTTPFDATGVKVWIDAVSKYCSISDDDATWVTPRSEGDADAISFDLIRRGELKTIYVQQDIPAGCPSNVNVPLMIGMSWDKFY